MAVMVLNIVVIFIYIVFISCDNEAGKLSVSPVVKDVTFSIVRDVRRKRDVTVLYIIRIPACLRTRLENTSRRSFCDIRFLIITITVIKLQAFSSLLTD